MVLFKRLSQNIKKNARLHRTESYTTTAADKSQKLCAVMERLFAGSFPLNNRSGTDCLLALIQTSLVALSHSRIFFF